MSTISIRHFIITDEDSIYRIANAKYTRMLDNNLAESIKSLAGQRVRSAVAAVKLQNRKPVEVTRFWFGHLEFREDGTLDIDRYYADNIFVLTAMDFRPIKRRMGSVIPAEQQFAKRRVENVVRWKPGSKLQRKLIDVALGKLSCDRL